jgi:hypothetical protein
MLSKRDDLVSVSKRLIKPKVWRDPKKGKAAPLVPLRS